MLSWLFLHILTVAALAACAFAIWKGGPAERASGLLIGAAWIASLLAYPLLSFAGAPAPYVPFAVDTLGAVGLLVLAVRYQRAWLGCAVFLQAAALALTAAFLTVEGYASHIYIAQENMIGAALILLLTAVTARTWVSRLRSPAVKGGGGSGEGGDGFPRQPFDAAPVAVAHRLVRR